MNAKKRAEKIAEMFRKEGGALGIDSIAAQIEEAEREVHINLAKTQAVIMGESVMLGGKIVTNEELYKQPTDYVKEAYASGFKAAREKAAGMLEKHFDLSKSPEFVFHSNACKELADRIRRMEP